jgi:hypothetical protein
VEKESVNKDRRSSCSFYEEHKVRSSKRKRPLQVT